MPGRRDRRVPQEVPNLNFSTSRKYAVVFILEVWLSSNISHVAESRAAGQRNDSSGDISIPMSDCAHGGRANEACMRVNAKHNQPLEFHIPICADIRLLMQHVFLQRSSESSQTLYPLGTIPLPLFRESRIDRNANPFLQKTTQYCGSRCRSISNTQAENI